MDSQKFNNYSSGFQHIVVALAVVIGGIWTLISFEALNQREIAKGQLEEINNRIKKIKIPALSLKTRLIKKEEKESIYQIKVEVTNIGNEILELSYSAEKSFQLTLITDVKDYGLTIDSSSTILPKLVSHHFDGSKQVLSNEVPPNATISVQTLAKLKRNSIYQISFKAELTDNFVSEEKKFRSRGVSEFLYVD
ncbi:hypothetical protein [Alteromonas sp. BMJM2]|uniref:hypothetical protein n=1 Tax=Alteromonas sp. BMJM2 TaxID=2954241 RepID=UPI0022B389F6|nr:hypothetical protein [Alteromonas sp. BMJM2]